jgi:8-oxo-dGTP pyrophosphatase MutT (NUDIX family)
MSPDLSEQTSLRPAVVATPYGDGPRPYTVAVDVLLLYTRGDDLLVGLRQGGYAAGDWDTPSGKLDPGETLEQGVAREAREETGLTFRPISCAWSR